MSAAKDGLRGEIENPLTGKPIGMREFLKWTLDELMPLADALDLREDLTPLVEMAMGGPNFGPIQPPSIANNPMANIQF